MDLSNSAPYLQTESPALAVGVVHDVYPDGSVIVGLRDEPARILHCSRLRVGTSELAHVPMGCVVLIWIDAANDRGVVLGLLDAPTSEPAAAPVPRSEERRVGKGGRS